MRRILPIFMMIFLVTTLGCAPTDTSKDSASDGGGGSTDPGGSTPSPIESLKEGVPLYLGLGIKWNSITAEVYDSVKVCSIPETAAAGTTIACDMSIEELRLYYSDLKFTVGTKKASACEKVSFTPYSYVRSVTTVPDPFSSTPIDCTVSPMPLGCFGGAAKYMVTGFPKNNGMYNLPVTTPEASYILKSEDELRTYFGSPVNYTVTNDASATTKANTGTGVRLKVAGGWTDYSLKCFDRWGATLYQINLVIADDNTLNTEGGTDDEFPDWD